MTRKKRMQPQTIVSALTFGAAIVLAPLGAMAQEGQTPVPSRSTESFADWNVECTLATAPVAEGETAEQSRLCEVVQIYSNANTGAEIARLAFAYDQDNAGGFLAGVRMVANVSFDSTPAILDGETVLFEGRFTRCVGGFCFAQLTLGADGVNTLQAAEALRLRYPLGNGSPIAIGVSTSGLQQALEALAARVQ